jgi:hypothetical protein
MRLLFVVLGMLIVLNVSAQWKDIDQSVYIDAIERVNEKTKKDLSYSYKVKYDLFRDLESSEIMSSGNGEVYCKKGIDLYSFQFGRIMVQNERYNVVIDTGLRAIVIQNHLPIYDLNQQVTQLQTSFDLSTISVKYRKDGNIEKYAVTYPPGQEYAEVDLWIDQNNTVIKTILFSAYQIEEGSEFYETKMIQPRIEITCSDYKFGNQFKQEGMKFVSDYISVNEKEILIINPIYQ